MAIKEDDKALATEEGLLIDVCTAERAISARRKDSLDELAVTRYATTKLEALLVARRRGGV